MPSTAPNNRNGLLAHFFNQQSQSPSYIGSGADRRFTFKSSVGEDRDLFLGRCIRGNAAGTTYLDFNVLNLPNPITDYFVSCDWIADASGVALTGSSTFDTYVNSFPLYDDHNGADVTNEWDESTGRFTLRADHYYKGVRLLLKSDNSEVGVFLFEYGTGTTLYNSWLSPSQTSTGTSLSVVNTHANLWDEGLSSVPFSFLNFEGFTFDGSNNPIVRNLNPANRNVASNGSAITFTGRAKQQLQCVDNACLISNNVWSIELTTVLEFSNISDITVNGVSRLSDFTVTIGAVTATARTYRIQPNRPLVDNFQIFDVRIITSATINPATQVNFYYFPIAENSGNVITGYDINGAQVEATTIGVVDEARGTQDVFAWNADRGTGNQRAIDFEPIFAQDPDRDFAANPLEFETTSLTIPYADAPGDPRRKRYTISTGAGGFVGFIFSSKIDLTTNGLEYRHPTGVFANRTMGFYADSLGNNLFAQMNPNGGFENAAAEIILQNFSVSNANFMLMFESNIQAYVRVDDSTLWQNLEGTLNSYKNNATIDPNGHLSNPANNNSNGILFTTGLELWYADSQVPQANKDIIDAFFLETFGETFAVIQPQLTNRVSTDLMRLTFALTDEILVPSTGSVTQLQGGNFTHNIITGGALARATEHQNGRALNNATNTRIVVSRQFDSVAFGGGGNTYGWLRFYGGFIVNPDAYELPSGSSILGDTVNSYRATIPGGSAYRIFSNIESRLKFVPTPLAHAMGLFREQGFTKDELITRVNSQSTSFVNSSNSLYVKDLIVYSAVDSQLTTLANNYTHS